MPPHAIDFILRYAGAAIDEAPNIYYAFAAEQRHIAL